MLGSLFGLAGNVLGYFGARSAADDAEDRFNAQMAWSREQFDRNEALQREFAQNGIRWRVGDAQAAGIHPLFALGAGGATYSPSVTAGGDNFSDTSAGYLANMGQDIGRAISATQTKDERLSDKLGALSLERAELENAYLRSKIAKETAQLGPPMPSLGNFEWKPPEITATQPDAPSLAAGPPVAYTQFVDAGDRIKSQPAPGLKAEDEFGAPLMAEWLWTNRIMPAEELRPPEHMWKKKWPWADGVEWSFLKQGFVPYRLRPGSAVIRQGEPIGDRPIDWGYMARNFHQGRKAYRGSNYSGSDGFSYIAP